MVSGIPRKCLQSWLNGWILCFQEECDSDVWDDTALIEAYDAAVAPLKVTTVILWPEVILRFMKKWV